MNANQLSRTKIVAQMLPSIGALTLFFMMPLAIMLYNSFREFTGPAAMSDELSFDNYIRFFSGFFYWSILSRTIITAAVVASLSVVLSYPLAYALARSSSRFRAVIFVLVVLPLITNLVVRNYGWMVIFSDTGLMNRVLLAAGLPKYTLMFSYTGVVIALTAVLAPYAVLSLYGVVQNIKPQLEESARSLGANSFHVAKDILFPLSRPGLIAGWILIFVQAMSAFATPMLIGGGGKAGQFLATVVFIDAVTNLNWPFAAATSFILTLLILCLIGIQQWLLGADGLRHRGANS